MAWERFFVSAFEDLYVPDMYAIDGFAGFDLTDELYHTGSHSVDNTNRNSDYYIPLRSGRKAVRMGAYINYNDALGNGIGMIKVRSFENVDNILYRYRLDYDAGDENFTFHVTEYDDFAGGVTTNIETISASSGGFTKLTWNHLGLIAVQGVDANDPGWISIYMNGERIIHYEITDQFYPWIDCGFPDDSNNQFAYWAFDDAYVDVSTTAEPDAPVPSPRFGALFPQADGIYQEWDQMGGNRRHEFLSQRPRPKTPQPYLHTEAADLRDTYKFRSWQGLDDWEIQAVIVRARAMASVPATPLHLVQYDGVTLEASPEVHPEISYNAYWHRFTEPPAGGAWGQSLEGYEFGVMS